MIESEKNTGLAALTRISVKSFVVIAWKKTKKNY